MNTASTLFQALAASPLAPSQLCRRDFRRAFDCGFTKDKRLRSKNLPTLVVERVKDVVLNRQLLFRFAMYHRAFSWVNDAFYRSVQLEHCLGLCMSFEVKDKDVLARIGRLRTKSGVVETPLLFPVVNPNVQVVPAKRLKQDFGFQAVITNAYILKRRFNELPTEKGVHRFLDFDGVVMTDSGAYQILVYGDVEVSPEEIVSYQERIGSDVATILDVPTGWKGGRTHAEETVRVTLNRAEQFSKTPHRDDILWVGPVQGGRYLDLVAESARQMGELSFQVHALGSPTEVMENYRFDVLVDMIMTAKMNLPVERPLHLFGAGHPVMFSLAVALGCDTFDSAAYALYAREDRYMTDSGTWRLNELDYFPCMCPRCSVATPKEVQALPKHDREQFLAEHNLHVCSAEVKRIKQAIRDGRLWEHMTMRAHAHPSLLTALHKLRDHRAFIEKFSPVAKRSGLFFQGLGDTVRPEVYRHALRLRERYRPPDAARTLLLVPQSHVKPFHKSQEFSRIRKTVQQLPAETHERIHVCFYAAPFGVVPMELDEVYPLSQHETAWPPSEETIRYVASEVADYIARSNYDAVVIFTDAEPWTQRVEAACREAAASRKIQLETINFHLTETKEILTRLQLILQQKTSEPT
jgi:7-cyano-7-deazaguanine tRNA-ribosyltransferase